MAKKKKVDTKSRIGGLLFLITIIAVFFVGIIALLANIIIVLNTKFHLPNLIVSFFGFVLGFIVFSGPGFIKLRTFLHESKHAIAVVLTGNKLKEFKAEDGSGYVTFEIYKDKLGFAPAIALAPYYFPLCSLPLFLLALFLGNSYPIVFSFLLGASCAVDILSGVAEIHPNQSDLKRIIGGFLIAAAFIGGFLFTWFNICLLWVLSGPSGFALAAKIAFIFLEKII